MTKSIPLTQGQVAIVDDEWFDELNKYKCTRGIAKPQNRFMLLEESILLKQKNANPFTCTGLLQTPRKEWT